MPECTGCHARYFRELSDEMFGALITANIRNFSY